MEDAELSPFTVNYPAGMSRPGQGKIPKGGTIWLDEASEQTVKLVERGHVSFAEGEPDSEPPELPPRRFPEPGTAASQNPPQNPPAADPGESFEDEETRG